MAFQPNLYIYCTCSISITTNLNFDRFLCTLKKQQKTLFTGSSLVLNVLLKAVVHSLHSKHNLLILILQKCFGYKSSDLSNSCL